MASHSLAIQLVGGGKIYGIGKNAPATVLISFICLIMPVGRPATPTFFLGRLADWLASHVTLLWNDLRLWSAIVPLASGLGHELSQSALIRVSLSRPGVTDAAGAGPVQRPGVTNAAVAGSVSGAGFW